MQGSLRRVSWLKCPSSTLSVYKMIKRAVCVKDFSDGPAVRLGAFTAGSVGSIPGRRSKIPAATQRDQKKKE